jgi:hypothetical protein
MTLADQAAGFARSTLYDLFDMDPEFHAKIVAADVDGIRRRLSRIEAAADGGEWRADVWMLSVQHPEHFGKQRLEVTGRDGGPVLVDARAQVLDAARALADSELGLTAAPSDERDE